ncbi:MAG: hypothetical protein JWM87_1383 [Candidatus Eremiobacteraeota bacterium]|nr:hypothetical protein [Candidatus Eremiobacteraeota bacterium]
MNTTDITVTRKIAAPADAIFRAFLDPTTPGGPWFGAARAIVNPVVDGLFYHAVEHEGKMWPHYGRFIRLDRPSRIEHTWVSEATKGLESVVTVTLEPHGAETEMTLHHTGVPDDEMGRQHKEGWTWMLSTIAERYASPPSPVPGG